MIKFTRHILIMAVLLNLLVFNFAHAIDFKDFHIVPCGRAGTPDCTTCDFFKMVKDTIDFIIEFVTPALATFFFIYAGFLMLLSGANPGFYGQAKNIFTQTVYAVIIILTAWLITNTFMLTFGPDNIAGFTKENWHSFACPAGLP